MSALPGWLRTALVVVPLLAAGAAGYVEYELHEAIEEIPDGDVHDEAWIMFNRIRKCNRATIGLSVLAAAFGACAAVRKTPPATA